MEIYDKMKFESPVLAKALELITLIYSKGLLNKQNIRRHGL